MDIKLKFNNHINALSKRISKSVGIIYKLSPYLSSPTLLNIYYSLVHSYLMYCNTVWGGTYQSHLQPLIVLQKRCIRIVHGSTCQAHSLPLFMSSKVLILRNIHLYNLACYVYKKYHLFARNIPSNSYELRRNLLVVGFQRLNICQRSIYYAGIKIWNALPTPLKSIDKLHIFKKHLKLFILELQSLSLQS